MERRLKSKACRQYILINKPKIKYFCVSDNHFSVPQKYNIFFESTFLYLSEGFFNGFGICMSKYLLASTVYL